MQVPATTSVAADTTTDPGSTRLPAKVLTQADFLRLVMAQMTNQDPLSPQKDTEFIAQMAQFSALEQSKSMQQDISKLQTDQEFMQANAVLGRAVTLQDSQGNLVSGTVSAVQVQAGTPQLIVNGRAYDLGALLSIAPVTSNP
jgi:flagellar basal-body rod modification protein FlgD